MFMKKKCIPFIDFLPILHSIRQCPYFNNVCMSFHNHAHFNRSNKNLIFVFNEVYNLVCITNRQHRGLPNLITFFEVI